MLDKLRDRRKIVKELLERWKLWQGLYPQWYIERHFRLYENEIRPLLRLLEEVGDAKP